MLEYPCNSSSPPGHHSPLTAQLLAIVEVIMEYRNIDIKHTERFPNCHQPLRTVDNQTHPSPSSVRTTDLERYKYNWFCFLLHLLHNLTLIYRQTLETRWNYSTILYFRNLKIQLFISHNFQKRLNTKIMIDDLRRSPFSRRFNYIYVYIRLYFIFSFRVFFFF